MAKSKFSNGSYDSSQYQWTQEMVEENKKERAENDAWLTKYSELRKQAAGYLNRYFPDVPAKKWLSAMESRNEPIFMDTAKDKEEKYYAALKWVDSEIGKWEKQ